MAEKWVKWREFGKFLRIGIFGGLVREGELT
jgi:hypothetical protein